MVARFFKVPGPIAYEGPDSRNPLAFRFYDPKRVVGGKTLKAHIGPSIACWHFLGGGGNDPFGDATAVLTWPRVPANLEEAGVRLDALFEAATILDMQYTFHDFDLAPPGANWTESRKNLDWLGGELEKRQRDTGVRCAWTTQNHFSHPRYMSGAATSSNFDSFAYAAAQTRAAIDLGHRIGANGHVFWGGREGPSDMLNYDLSAALDRRGRALNAAVEYRKAIGFKGDFRIEPKPKEPTSVQLDSDVPGCVAFLVHYGLKEHFTFNLEHNHAILAGHPFPFELAYAAHHGMLGSIDANQGNYLLGWDTDDLPTSPLEAALAFVEILKAGGFKTGGTNFDAKVRRQSITPEDRIIAHIGALDAYALGVMTAHVFLTESRGPALIAEQAASWKKVPLAGRVMQGDSVGLAELEAYILDKGGVSDAVPSGREEEIRGELNWAMARAIRAL